MDITELYGLIQNAQMRISTDSRTIQPGEVYIALKGDVYDGNSFVKEVLEKGALYAIIDDPAYKVDERCIVVANTVETLQALATLHRQRFTIPIIAIGGSNGKTTTKELITAVLVKKYHVHTTKGNLNNEIGVPITILSLTDAAEIAVIEMGANHSGEHTRLMKIVSPTHVLVTNNGADHLEGFTDLAGVRKANKEVYNCARFLQATAFVNKNLLDLVEDSQELNRVLYPEANIESTSQLYASLQYNGHPVTSQLFGSFNEANILAAMVVGDHFKVPMNTIVEAIANYQPTLKRSQIIEKDGYIMIIDCYNANPTSMKVSLEVFFQNSEAGKRIIVVGDMFEVGAMEEIAHREAADLIKAKIDANDVVICVGPRFSLYEGHQGNAPFHFFANSQAARLFFQNLEWKNKKIFLKASRGIHLEDILRNDSL